MAISRRAWFDYHTILRANRAGDLTGIAGQNLQENLLGSRPAVLVREGGVTLSRRWRGVLQRSLAARATFDGGEALRTVLRPGDTLACWRVGTGDIGLSVRRAGTLVLMLGTPTWTSGSDVTVEGDPRLLDTQLARDVRHVDRPEVSVVWLDPERPSELEARIRELDGDRFAGHQVAVVVRTDDDAVARELNRRLMMPRTRPSSGGATFLVASPRFSGLEEWLQYGRALSTDPPPDLWLRIRVGGRERQVTEGTTVTFDGWLAHVHRAVQPGIFGGMPLLGLVASDAGVTPAMLESSTAAMARGPIL